jgi:hypothetical protein
MSYADTLVPGKVVDLRRKYGTVGPIAETVSEERALDHVAYVLAMGVWRMIETTIQGKDDLTELIKEQYPFIRGVATTLGVDDEFMSMLGIMASSAPGHIRFDVRD